MEVDAANVIIDAVKKAEDSDALMVRMYEAHGKNANAKLSFGFPVKRAQLVDLMEEHPKAVRVSGSGVKLSFTPFEIKTLRVS
jgi:alpha-mannosidase